MKGKTKSTKWTKTWKQKNPKRYAYQTLKANAKRRGKFFNLTYEEFLVFCYRYKYIGKKGRTKDGYGVDRVNEEGGYTLDNMKLKKNGNNLRKWKDYEYRTRTAINRSAGDSEETDLPF